ncbi:hypothetical protein Dimus_038114 [Dionaea muscipula]
MRLSPGQRGRKYYGQSTVGFDQSSCCSFSSNQPPSKLLPSCPCSPEGHKDLYNKANLSFLTSKLYNLRH